MMTRQLISTLILTLFSLQINAQCNIIYVTPNGIGTGSKTNPMSIENAFQYADSGDVIRLSTGVYELDQALTIISSNILVEGGFIEGTNWNKTSQYGATTIKRRGVNPETSDNNLHFISIKANEISNFEIHDVKIKVEDLNGDYPGASTYCLLLNNCSDYKLIRVGIEQGNAANGLDGIDGAIGENGGNGSMGQNGHCSTNVVALGGTGGYGGGNCCTYTSPGTTGIYATGQNGSAGGGGGKGGASSSGMIGAHGGSQNGTFSTGGYGGSLGGNNGGSGSSGANGAYGTSGNNGSPVAFDAFFIPGGIGETGSPGNGGNGGGGGGGGGGISQSSWGFFSNSTGNGGGGGGGGGQGGYPGTGASGGGGSFGIYLYNNGEGSEFLDCIFVSADAGNKGTPGIGGMGGFGGNRGSNNTYCSSDSGAGGFGGFGGNGGKGGDGGSSFDGISSQIKLVSGSNYILESNIDLNNQPVIYAEEISCTYEISNFESISSTSWNLGSNAFPNNLSGTSVQTQFTATGFQDIEAHGQIYRDFIFVNCEKTVMTDSITECDSYTWIDGNTYTTSNNEASWSIPSENGCDTLLFLNLELNYSSSGTDVITACDAYTWIDGNTYTTNNQSATYTLINQTGCDSTITLDLTISTVDTSVLLVNQTNLVALQAGAAYQWIDCNNGNEPLIEETNQVFIGLENGSYAVEISYNGCIGVSSCYDISTIGIEEHSQMKKVEVYPNPSSDEVFFSIEGAHAINIELIDLQGKVLQHHKDIVNQDKISLSGLAPGSYFLNVLNKENPYTIRILKN